MEGKQIKTVPLVFDDLANFINIGNKFFWNFIPRRLGGILVIENLECSSVAKTRRLGQDLEQAEMPSVSHVPDH